MSISTGKNKDAGTPLFKNGSSFPPINMKHIVASTIRSISKNVFDLILSFCFLTTAIGELFGQEYNLKWYILLLILLVVFVVREVVDPSPKIGLKEKNNTTQ